MSNAISLIAGFCKLNWQHAGGGARPKKRGGKFRDTLEKNHFGRLPHNLEEDTWNIVSVALSNELGKKAQDNLKWKL